MKRKKYTISIPKKSFIVTLYCKDTLKDLNHFYFISEYQAEEKYRELRESYQCVQNITGVITNY